MSKFKYLRKFSRFEKNEMITEEISAQGWLRMAMEALPLFMGGGAYGQQQQIGKEAITLQQAMQNMQNKGGGPLGGVVSMIISRTNLPAKDKLGKVVNDEPGVLGHSNYMWTNSDTLLQHMPTTGKLTRYIKGTIGDIKNAINSQDVTFKDFKFITEAEARADGMKDNEKFNGVDVADYLRVGDMRIDHKGMGTFTLSQDDSTEVVLGGNGIWAMLRMIQEQRQQPKMIDVCRIEMGMITGSKKFSQIQVANMNLSLNKAQQMKTLNYILEMSIPGYQEKTSTTVTQGTLDGKKYDEFSHALLFRITKDKTIADLKNVSDQEIAKAFTDFFNKCLTDFMPKENNQVMDLGISGFKVLSESEALDYLTKFKSSKTDQERDVIMESVKKNFKNIYLENFTTFVNNYIGSGGDKLFSEFMTSIKNAVWKHYDSNKTQVASAKGGATEGEFRTYVYHVQKYQQGDIRKSDAGATKQTAQGKPGEISTTKKYNIDKNVDPTTIKKESLRHLKKFKFFR
jgi:hypothetical protein